MLNRLPEFIDPIAFADRQKQLIGEIALNSLTRLGSALSDDNGVVNIDLSFFKEGRLAVIQGTINASLKVECQSCLEAMDWDLNLTTNLAVVNSLEQADKLAGEYEPLILDEERIPLNQIIEDELLLALPDFPRHQQKCSDYQESVLSVEEDNEKTQSNNPFSVLAQLKNTGDK